MIHRSPKYSSLDAARADIAAVGEGSRRARTAPTRSMGVAAGNLIMQARGVDGPRPEASIWQRVPPPPGQVSAARTCRKRAATRTRSVNRPALGEPAMACCGLLGRAGFRFAGNLRELHLGLIVCSNVRSASATSSASAALKVVARIRTRATTIIDWDNQKSSSRTRVHHRSARQLDALRRDDASGHQARHGLPQRSTRSAGDVLEIAKSHPLVSTIPRRPAR